MPRRLLLRCVLPPLGAALAAHALLDFAAYSTFVHSLVGFGWSPFSTDGLLEAREATVLGFLLAGLVAFAATRWTNVPTLRALGWTALTVGLAAPLALAHTERASLLSAHFSESCTDGYRWDLHAVREALALQAAGGALVLASLLCLRRPKSFEWLLGLLAGVGVLAVVSLVERPLGMGWPTGDVGDVLANAAMREAATAHRAVLGLVWLGAALLAVHRVQLRKGIQTRGAIIACGLAALAFVGTRALGHDGQAFLPHVWNQASLRPAAVLPSLARCDASPRWVNAVQLDDDGVWLSGTLLARRGDVTTRAATAEKVADQKLQFEDLHSDLSVCERPPYLLALQAAPSTPMADLLPLLHGIADEGVSALQLESARTLALDSATVGHLEVHPRCVRTFTLADDGVPVEQFATWGDVAAALDRGELRLKLPR